MATRAPLDRADRCPYEKPFPRGFSRCPGFSPVPFRPLDSRDQELQPIVTCAHLAVGSADSTQGRFYPRCSLGRVPEPADR
jgi:hypothetical protein